MSKALRRAIAIAGSQAKLAKMIGLRQPSVAKWLERGIPAERAIDIERCTGVSRSELRPDLWPQDDHSRGAA